MSTTPDNNDELNDADLAALFAADSTASTNTSPGSELDALILENARTAQLVSANHASNETFLEKYTPVIATAAVLLIGIALTPLATNTSTYETSKVAAGSDTSQAGEAMTLAGSAAESISLQNNAPRADLDSDASTEVEVVAEADTSAESAVIADSDAAAEPDITADSDAAAEPEITAESDDDVSLESETTEGTEGIVAELDARTKQANAPAPQAEITEQSTDSFSKDSATIVSELNSPNLAAPSNSAFSLQDNLVDEKSGVNPVLRQSGTERISSAAKRVEPVKEVESELNGEPEKKRVRPENFRDSPLLWVIEIKHLHNEKNDELARKELNLFRQKFPNNANERLLPSELQQR